MNIRFYGFTKEFKDGILEGLFDGISLGPNDLIILGFLVVSSVGVSVGSSEGFKDGNIDGTIWGGGGSPKDLNMKGVNHMGFCWIPQNI